MAYIDIEVTGLKELDAALAELSMNMQKRYMATANREGAKIIQAGAKARVPIRGMSKTGSMFRELVRVSKGSTKFRAPGFLKASVTVWKARRVIDSKATMAYHVGVRGLAFYGKFLEFGTSKMSARPWLRPALDALWTYAVDQTAAKLRDEIRSNWRKENMAGMTYTG